MKGFLRAESAKKHIAMADNSTQMEPVDVEQIRNELREELRKKLVAFLQNTLPLICISLLFSFV